MPTTRDLHSHRAEELDPTTDADRDLTHVAVGTDGEAKAITDDALGDEVVRVSFAEIERTDTQLRVRGFLDSSQANGEMLREVAVAGAASGGPVFALEALEAGDEVDKDDSTTVTIDITIDALDASEV